jgi:hypothetical protein
VSLVGCRRDRESMPEFTGISEVRSNEEYAEAYSMIFDFRCSLNLKDVQLLRISTIRENRLRSSIGCTEANIGPYYLLNYATGRKWCFRRLER